MSSWHKEYLAALYERDKKERANQDVFNNYTKLADRIATLASAIASNTGQAPEVEPTSKPAQNAGVAGPQPPPSGSSEAISRIRHDLSVAQRSKGEIQAQLQQLSEDMQDLKAQSKADSKRINELMTERNALVTRIKDRDEELRGKAKLLMDVQDETVALNLQLHMAEQESEKLKRENKELVDRWMARMGEEADAMNNASRFS